MEKYTQGNNQQLWRGDTCSRHYGNKQNSDHGHHMFKYTFQNCWVNLQKTKIRLWHLNHKSSRHMMQEGLSKQYTSRWCLRMCQGQAIRNGIALDVISRNKHIPEIEWYIRTAKERVRGILNSLPIKQYPPRLIAEMVYNVILWLNSFPHKDGVHATISPRTLLMELAIYYNKHCKMAFGTYK